ncbi:MAG TPA: mercuric reductase [Candidatus Binataceae bacterium]|nr:mercuric reductase [Candidatus Binataceae bacterium]
MAFRPLEHLPDDAFNRDLVAKVHPAGWSNPEPARRYNLVVVGAGTAGLVTAAGASTLGAKVALVEREFMGGDCLNFGCVPSKALIRSARVIGELRRAAELGIEVPAGVKVDFPAIMNRMRKLRAELSPADSAERFRGLGADVFFGDAKFVAPDCVEVEGKKLRFKKALIATGARAAEPQIPGIAAAGYLTNETIFSLNELPLRMAVIGAGPIGCELAQTFQRLGTQVTLLEMAPQILIREDPDAAAIIEASLKRDGVEIRTGCRIVSVARRDNERVITLEQVGEIVIDEILVGVGRTPAVEGLSLDEAKVQYDRERGIVVDDHLRTTNPLIFAAGDVASTYKFTHLSDAHARIAIRNALFMGRSRVSALTIPWCTYTDPEIAHVGLSEAEAKTRGVAIKTFMQPLAEVDRAVLDGETEGFVKIHVKEGTDQIAGATIVASHAGEMISEITTAIAGGVGLGRIGDIMHPYPTQADAIRRTSGLYSRTRLTPLVANLFRRWFALTR